MKYYCKSQRTDVSSSWLYCFSVYGKMQKAGFITILLEVHINYLRTCLSKAQSILLSSWISWNTQCLNSETHKCLILLSCSSFPLNTQYPITSCSRSVFVDLGGERNALCSFVCSLIDMYSYRYIIFIINECFLLLTLMGMDPIFHCLI